FRMQACHLKIPGDMHMKHRSVTEADDPFRVLGELGKVDLIDDTHRTITTPGTQYCLNRWILQHSLKILSPLLIRSPESSVFESDGLPRFNVQSPGFDLADSRH